MKPGKTIGGKMLLAAAVVFSLQPLLTILSDIYRRRVTGLFYLEWMHALGNGAVVVLTACLGAMLLHRLGVKEGLIGHKLLSAIGLCYSVGHFVLYLWSYGFVFNFIFPELLKQGGILVGNIALVLLFAIQISSIRKVRSRWRSVWKVLHAAYYPAMLLIFWHVWQVSKVIKPVFYIQLGFFLLLCVTFAIVSFKTKGKKREKPALFSTTQY